MDVNTVIYTSLEALLERATNIKNRNLDEAAYNAFSSMVSNEVLAAPVALKLIVPKLQSRNEWEATQTLSLLENCMEYAGPNFQAEVGKFKFLNELIKLVSVKHRGNQTPYSVKSRITQMLYSWSVKYPSEFKIREACEMLKKQGVTMDDVLPINIVGSSTGNLKSEPKVLSENEKKEKLLQKLLQSAKPHDLRAANLLIQTMVKEEEDKEVLDDLKNTLDLKLITNNVKLLSEMLSTYSSNSSQEETEIITQLYESCIQMKESLTDMIMTHSKSSHVYAELFSLNDYLNDTVSHYRDVFYSKPSNRDEDDSPVPSLLDLGSPTHNQNSSIPAADTPVAREVNKTRSNLDALEEIFNSSLDPLDPLESSGRNITCSLSPATSPSKNNENLVCANNITTTTNAPTKKFNNSLFDDLDALGKSMLNMKTNSSSVSKTEIYPKVTLNELTTKPRTDVSDFLMSMVEKNSSNIMKEDNVVELTRGEDVDIVKTETPTSDDDILLLDSVISGPNTPKRKTVQPLSDICVPLVKVVPGDGKKISALNDDNDLRIEIQVAVNKPREDVTVYLLFVTSRKEQAISEFLFQPVVPKDCRLKLQPPTRTELPPYNPYIPNDVIVQIMLISSSNQEYIPLKFVASYKMEDESFTEMGQIDELPL